VDAGPLRPDRDEPVGAFAATGSDRSARVAAPAVVIQFGTQALGLARSPLTLNRSDALTAADEDIESRHGSVFGPNETNAELLDVLDSNARRGRLLTPGTTERESGLLYQPPNNPQSGFVRSSGATEAESPLASDGLDDGVDWFFPGSPSSLALDVAFTRSDAELEAESTSRELTGTIFDATQLNAEQRRETQNLEQSGRQARAHERAQRAALESYTSSVQLRYEPGPDGRRYLVEAEVPLDVTPVPGDPAATLRKMEAIRRATSSGRPSSSARNAAAEAAQLAMRARAELAAERYAEAQESDAKELRLLGLPDARPR
jgi:hypothetical protein